MKNNDLKSILPLGANLSMTHIFCRIRPLDKAGLLSAKTE